MTTPTHAAQTEAILNRLDDIFVDEMDVRTVQAGGRLIYTPGDLITWIRTGKFND